MRHDMQPVGEIPAAAARAAQARSAAWPFTPLPTSARERPTNPPAPQPRSPRPPRLRLGSHSPEVTAPRRPPRRGSPPPAPRAAAAGWRVRVRVSCTIQPGALTGAQPSIQRPAPPATRACPCQSAAASAARARAPAPPPPRRPGAATARPAHSRDRRRPRAATRRPERLGHHQAFKLELLFRVPVFRHMRRQRADQPAARPRRQSGHARSAAPWRPAPRAFPGAGKPERRRRPRTVTSDRCHCLRPSPRLRRKG